MARMHAVRVRTAAQTPPMKKAVDALWDRMPEVGEKIPLMAKRAYDMLLARKELCARSRDPQEFSRLNEEQHKIVRQWTYHVDMFEKLLKRLQEHRQSTLIEVIVAARPVEGPDKTFVPFGFEDDLRGSKEDGQFFPYPPFLLCTEWFQRPGTRRATVLRLVPATVVN